MEGLLTQIQGVVFVIEQTNGGQRCHPFKMILENQKENTLEEIAKVFKESYITDNVLYMPKQECIVAATPFKDTKVIEYTIMPMKSEAGKKFMQTKA